MKASPMDVDLGIGMTLQLVGHVETVLEAGEIPGDETILRAEVNLRITMVPEAELTEEVEGVLEAHMAEAIPKERTVFRIQIGLGSQMVLGVTTVLGIETRRTEMVGAAGKVPMIRVILGVILGRT
ncbi:hypothetical protein GNI_008340 [Gregarina niphandrodes]|uniref:Uncharacterized protein n=1 Tax=Gregarina niphandrodes TaxID=110365 RepID=A0A023BCZ9_GRENI|nr:hypothetical protein GNI_008340 [Gregarina niphandrodes]EZG87069.1 hypothetical protein GNI_008340 [Gregarina niphandrodes]|eukprot:XP_011128711.1 hypothetical protein GNI_008340 [Gregarina niphandrodes]